jgi:anti-sigma28 factor (negative regulator of flagellin synthesis)
MKLSVGQIHDLYLGLSMLEQAPDVKLTGDVRIRIAIDINKLKPIASAYERARTRTFADLQKQATGATKKSDAEVQSELVEENEKIRGEEHELELRTFLKTDLRLDDNPKITGAMMAQIWPVLEQFDAV